LGRPGYFCPTTRRSTASFPDPGLGGRVGRPGGFALECRRRRHVDDHAATSRKKLWDDVFHAGDISAQIHRHHPVPQLKVDVDDIGVGAHGAHVRADVEDGIHTAVGGGGELDQRGDRTGIGEIERPGNGLTAGGDEGVGGLLGRLGRNVTDHNRAPFRTETLGGGRPDAGGRAGDDDDLSGQAAQSHGHLPSLSGTI